ncbi:MAG: DUF2807 domain-containing protein, partial [Bacteroidota bacterium]
FIVMCCSLVLLSCDSDPDPIIPSSNITKRSLNITDYTKINVSAPFQVFIRYSATEESIEMEANDNLHSLIQINKLGDELMVRLDEEDLKLSGTETFKLHIKTANLLQYTASGEATITLENTLESNQAIEVNLSGEAVLTGALAVEEFNVQSSGDAQLHLEGGAQLLNLTLSGESKMLGFNLTVDELNADLSGEGVVELVVNQKISVMGAGESILRYRGDAVIELQTLSHNAEVIKVN